MGRLQYVRYQKGMPEIAVNGIPAVKDILNPAASEIGIPRDPRPVALLAKPLCKEG